MALIICFLRNINIYFAQWFYIDTLYYCILQGHVIWPKAQLGWAFDTWISNNIMVWMMLSATLKYVCMLFNLFERIHKFFICYLIPFNVQLSINQIEWKQFLGWQLGVMIILYIVMVWCLLFIYYIKNFFISFMKVKGEWFLILPFSDLSFVLISHFCPWQPLFWSNSGQSRPPLAGWTLIDLDLVIVP